MSSVAPAGMHAGPVAEGEEALAAVRAFGPPAADLFGPTQVARGAGHTPLQGREARFVCHPLLLWDDPADDERNIAFGRGYREDLRPFSTGAAYLNFIGDEGAARVRAAFGPNYERLNRVKSDWDPDGVFAVHTART
jgi:hypothetical protein